MLMRCEQIRLDELEVALGNAASRELSGPGPPNPLPLSTVWKIQQPAETSFQLPTLKHLHQHYPLASPQYVRVRYDSLGRCEAT